MLTRQTRSRSRATSQAAASASPALTTSVGTLTSTRPSARCAAHRSRRIADFRQFRCELCGRPFRRLDALNRHVKLENEQVCTVSDGEGGRCLAHSDGHCEAARANQALLGPSEHGHDGLSSLPGGDDDDFAI